MISGTTAAYNDIYGYGNKLNKKVQEFFSKKIKYETNVSTNEKFILSSQTEKITKSSFFIKPFDLADDLFGEMRPLNEEEANEYKNFLNNDFKNTGVNFFDLL